MTIWAHWRGLIARTGVDTRDGRRLELGDFEPAHFVRLPVPVTARPKPGTEADPFEIVGRVDRVSIRSNVDGRGKDIHGEGVLNLDDLFRVRPDLRIANPVGPADEATLWPVGVAVIGGEFAPGSELVGQPIVMQGAWELAALAIEHADSVWPGVGIELNQLEDDGRIKP